MFHNRVEVRSLLETPGGSLEVSGVMDVPELSVGGNVFRFAEPAPYHVWLSNAGAGIVAHGTITARVSATCARCLCEYTDELAGEVDELYLRPGSEAPDDADTEWIAEDGSVDLGPALTAALVVEAPFVPLHDPECAGLCPVCGVDLNTESCSCAGRADEDHPFAVLKELFEPEGSGD